MSAHNFWDNFTFGFMNGMFNNNPFLGGCMNNFNFFPSFNSCFTPMFSPFQQFNLFNSSPNIMYMYPNVMSQSSFYPYTQMLSNPPSLWNMQVDVNQIFPNEKWQTNTTVNSFNYEHNNSSGDVFVRNEETKSKTDSTVNSNTTKKLSKTDCNTYDTIIEKYAKKYNVNPNLVKAIIKQESSFNAKAVSPAGAKGLMQLMPPTAASLNVKDVFNPEQNIEGGVKYISQMLKKYNGNTRLALAAYNAGAANVKNGKIPQNGETPKFVEAVMKYYNEYQQA